MTAPSLTSPQIFRLWWPLALSWLLMGVELPLVAAVIARLPAEEANLAALSSLVYPLALLLEAPIIMLLAASTALAKDAASYRFLARFTHGAGLLLTLGHISLAFTPLFDEVALHWVGVDPELLEPGRLGLQIMTPWSWAIAARRFQQGVLIRAGRPRMVVWGTALRLAAECLTLLLLFVWLASGDAISGTAGMLVGTSGIIAGVCAEAAFAAWAVRPCRAALDPEAAEEPLSRRRFLAFYLPLAVTPFMTLLLQSLGAATMNRMPEKLASTACWSAVYGLLFLSRSAGFAFNEVVVSQIDAPGGVRALRRFAWMLGGTMVALLLLTALTPLGRLWFATLIDLESHLVPIALGALCWGVLMPGYAVLQSFYQGALVQARRTRGVTEAVTLYLVVAGLLLGLGIYLQPVRGIVWVLAAFNFAGILQTLWAARRARPVLEQLQQR